MTVVPETERQIQRTAESQGECLNCHRPFGDYTVCNFCSQVEGLPVGIVLASVGRRFGGYLLGILLTLGTLVIGYAIWCFIIYDRGQTPAKQLMGMRVVRLDRGRRADWGTMFLRGWIYATIIGFVSAFVFYIPLLWLAWDRKNQQLWDKMAGTIVVNDPDDVV